MNYEKIKIENLNDKEIGYEFNRDSIKGSLVAATWSCTHQVNNSITCSWRIRQVNDKGETVKDQSNYIPIRASLCETYTVPEIISLGGIKIVKTRLLHRALETNPTSIYFGILAAKLVIISKEE